MSSRNGWSRRGRDDGFFSKMVHAEEQGERLMAEVAVGSLLRHFPRMKLAGAPAFTRNAFFRKVVSLPLRLR